MRRQKFSFCTNDSVILHPPDQAILIDVFPDLPLTGHGFRVHRWQVVIDAFPVLVVHRFGDPAGFSLQQTDTPYGVHRKLAVVDDFSVSLSSGEAVIGDGGSGSGSGWVTFSAFRLVSEGYRSLRSGWL